MTKDEKELQEMFEQQEADGMEMDEFDGEGQQVQELQ